jgi:hypothetical protein
VDIYHTDPNHPRFAYVQYTTLDSGAAAIDALHDKPIDFASPYAKENADDLADWAGWQGSMKVVRNGEGRFIPGPVEELFPGIAPWMVGKKTEVPAKEPDVGAKRSRSADGVNTEKYVILWMELIQIAISQASAPILTWGGQLCSPVVRPRHERRPTRSTGCGIQRVESSSSPRYSS